MDIDGWMLTCGGNTSGSSCNIIVDCKYSGPSACCYTEGNCQSLDCVNASGILAICQWV